MNGEKTMPSEHTNEDWDLAYRISIDNDFRQSITSTAKMIRKYVDDNHKELVGILYKVFQTITIHGHMDRDTPLWREMDKFLLKLEGEHD
jgi:hypothetical protein